MSIYLNPSFISQRLNTNPGKFNLVSDGRTQALPLLSQNIPTATKQLISALSSLLKEKSPAELEALKNDTNANPLRESVAQEIINVLGHYSIDEEKNNQNSYPTLQNFFESFGKNIGKNKKLYPRIFDAVYYSLLYSTKFAGGADRLKLFQNSQKSTNSYTTNSYTTNSYKIVYPSYLDSFNRGYAAGLSNGKNVRGFKLAP